MMFTEAGKTKEEAVKTVADAMYEYIKPQINLVKRLSSNSLFIPVLMLTMPIKFSRTLGYGREVNFPKAPANEFKMTTHKCIYAQIFSKYGYPEMTVVFCKADDILYGDLPTTDFEYTGQIGNGGTVCDYTFRRRKCYCPAEQEHKELGSERAVSKFKFLFLAVARCEGSEYQNVFR